MLRLIILFLLLTVTRFGYSQTDTAKIDIDTTKIFFFADKMPQYPGGDEALSEYISNQVKVPVANVGQKMFVKVVVRHDGTCKGTELVLGIDNPRINRAVIKAIASITNWIPAQHNGKVVWAQRTIEIKLARKK